jgi:laminin alpha 3/5
VQDYFVLLPAAFYEATVLVDHVYTPCEVGNRGLCRHFSYPNLTQFDMVRGGGGYRIVNEERKPLDVYFRDEQVTSSIFFEFCIKQFHNKLTETTSLISHAITLA